MGVSAEISQISDAPGLVGVVNMFAILDEKRKMGNKFFLMIYDIAPTLASYLGVKPPSGAIGAPLPEVLGN